jgi:hypothetical protein
MFFYVFLYANLHWFYTMQCKNALAAMQQYNWHMASGMPDVSARLIFVVPCGAYGLNMPSDKR